MVREAFRAGWQKFKENWKLLVAAQLTTLILSAVFNSLSENYPLVYIPAIILGVVMGIGLMKIYLKIADGESASLKDLFLHYRLFFKMILAQLVAGLIGALAFLPLALSVGLLVTVNNSVVWIVGSIIILAGLLFIIHVSLRLMFVQYLVVDKELGPVAAVKGSFAITKNKVIKLFLFGLAAFLVTILGVLALFIGLFAAIPVITLATVYVYRELSK